MEIRLHQPVDLRDKKTWDSCGDVHLEGGFTSHNDSPGH
jgi:hypothetical protein